MEKESKICQSCGRPFEMRKSLSKNWDQVKYCSDACRKNKNKYNYKKQILELLQIRGPGKSICPSEVLSAPEKQDKVLMEHVRRSARLLADQGLIEITQGGSKVGLDFKGPIRLRLRNS